MKYIVIEKHGGWEYSAIVTDEDGNVKIFDKLEDAEMESSDCQDGIVVGDGMTELGEEGVDWNRNKEIEQMKYLIREMYNSHKDGTFNIAHIGDLICNVLGINAIFLPSGKIIENE